MSRQKSKNLIFQVITASVVITILIGFFCITKYYARNMTETANAKNTYPKIEDILNPQKESLNRSNEIKVVVQPKNENTETAFQSMPILMYHHIRNYNDEHDKIGTNLSVQVDDFKKQLDLIQSKGYETTTFEELSNGVFHQKPIILTFDDGYQNFYTSAYPELKRRGMKAVVNIIVNDKSDLYMNDSEIKEVSENGIEIGSHTLSHPDLSKIGLNKATNEITESKVQLEKIIGKKVVSFCYPAGKFNQEVENIVKNAGYLFATTTNPGRTNFNNLFELTRHRVNKDTNITKFIQ